LRRDNYSHSSVSPNRGGQFNSYSQANESASRGAGGSYSVQNNLIRPDSKGQEDKGAYMTFLEIQL